MHCLNVILRGEFNTWLIRERYIETRRARRGGASSILSQTSINSSTTLKAMEFRIRGYLVAISLINPSRPSHLLDDASTLRIESLLKCHNIRISFLFVLFFFFFLFISLQMIVEFYYHILYTNNTYKYFFVPVGTSGIFSKLFSGRVWLTRSAWNSCCHLLVSRFDKQTNKQQTREIDKKKKKQKKRRTARRSLPE